MRYEIQRGATDNWPGENRVVTVTGDEWEPVVRNLLQDMPSNEDYHYLIFGLPGGAAKPIGEWQVNTVQVGAGTDGLIMEFLVDGPGGDPNTGFGYRIVRAHLAPGEDEADADLVNRTAAMCLIRCFVDGVVHPALGEYYRAEQVWSGADAQSGG